MRQLDEMNTDIDLLIIAIINILPLGFNVYKLSHFKIENDSMHFSLNSLLLSLEYFRNMKISRPTTFSLVYNVHNIDEISKLRYSKNYYYIILFVLVQLVLVFGFNWPCLAASST
jgi:hypothetical protein